MSFKYEVAISFAGEDRGFAEAVAKGLQNEGVIVFYDKFYEADLWGKDLSVEFRDVYHESSKFVIMVLSKRYVDKIWTNFERQQAIERLIKEKGNDYILPVRLDGFTGDVPGLSGLIHHLSVNSREPEKVVRVFIEKINGIRRQAKLQLDAQKITDRLIQQYLKPQETDQSGPICVLVPPRHLESVDKRGELVEKIDPVPDDPRTPYYAGTYAIRCALRNLGTGPALNLRITFKFPDGQTSEPFELLPLGAQEIRGGENDPLLVSIPLDVPQYGIKHTLNRADFEKITSGWEIWLEYEDTLGKKYCTVHHKSPLKPWIAFMDNESDIKVVDPIESARGKAERLSRKHRKKQELERFLKSGDGAKVAQNAVREIFSHLQTEVDAIRSGNPHYQITCFANENLAKETEMDANVQVTVEKPIPGMVEIVNHGCLLLWQQERGANLYFAKLLTHEWSQAYWQSYDEKEFRFTVTEQDLPSWYETTAPDRLYSSKEIAEMFLSRLLEKVDSSDR